MFNLWELLKLLANWKLRDNALKQASNYNICLANIFWFKSKKYNKEMLKLKNL